MLAWAFRGTAVCMIMFCWCSCRVVLAFVDIFVWGLRQGIRNVFNCRWSAPVGGPVHILHVCQCRVWPLSCNIHVRACTVPEQKMFGGNGLSEYPPQQEHRSSLKVLCLLRL